MRFAYADPPYLGEASRLYGHLHPDAAEYDKPETHRALVERLEAEYDGWALSLHVPSLRTILPMVPEEARVCAWVKPFAVFKPKYRQAYAWEPVIVKPARRRPVDAVTVPDFVSANITLQRGVPGAKPEAFAFWLFAFAGLEAADEFVDVFEGSGAIGEAWDRWRRQVAMPIRSVRKNQAQLGAGL